MKAIEVRHLKKAYGDFMAVDDISFSVDEGSLFAFLGENGAGKSTTINMLCTILQKSSGEADILGYRLGQDDDKIRDRIGIVFQHSVLDPELTVRENILTRGAYYGLSSHQVDQRLAAFSELFDYNRIKNQHYADLSGGQRRQVDLMRALINQPKILFLDEPTTGLDSKARQNIWQYLNLLRQELHLTIFLTTHYMEETKNCDQVVIIDHGKIIADASPQQLKNSYTYPKLLWYTDRSKSQEEILEGLDYEYKNDHYVIKFVGDIHPFLYQYRDRIQDFEFIKGDMDDVFLNITGRVMKR